MNVGGFKGGILHFLGRILVCGGCFRWLRIPNGSLGRLPGLSCGWTHWVGCALSGVCAGILLLSCLRVGAIWWCLTLISSVCNFFCKSAGYGGGWWPSWPLLLRPFLWGKAVVDSLSVLGVAFHSCQSVRPFIIFYTSVTRDPCQSCSSAIWFEAGNYFPGGCNRFVFR
jgi:hypothetical protein